MAAGYFLLVEHLSRTRGLPLAVYTDRHTIFQSPRKATIAEELAGKPPRSQFGRRLDELSIELIPAYSPQAKGRIERLFGTLQDRLVKALRRPGAASLQDANRVLHQFLPGYNNRFAIRAAQPGSAYRPWPPGLPPETVFCFKHERMVTNDNTLSFNGHRLPIAPGRHRSSYARCRIEVRQLLNGQLLVCHQGTPISRFAPLEPGPPAVGDFAPLRPPKPPRRVRPSRASAKPPRTPYKPRPDHPWHQLRLGAPPKKPRG